MTEHLGSIIMNPISEQALRIALDHETTSVIKQLQAELRCEKAAHTRIRAHRDKLQIYINGLAAIESSEITGFCEVCFETMRTVVRYRTPHSYHPNGANRYSACRVCRDRHETTGYPQ